MARPKATEMLTVSLKEDEAARNDDLTAYALLSMADDPARDAVSQLPEEVRHRVQRVIERLESVAGASSWESSVPLWWAHPMAEVCRRRLRLFERGEDVPRDPGTGVLADVGDLADVSGSGQV